MAGHSKWANIKHRKGAQDALRSKEFMKLAKEIFVAAQIGGGDPGSNANLRFAISKAKSRSMPSKNIKKAIDKATGVKAEGVTYKEYTYEGYLPGGVSIMLNCLTDNHNRLASNVKSIFNKNGGTLAKTGAVSYLFKHIGIVEINKTLSEDELMELIIEGDPEDIQITDKSFIILCSINSFSNIKEILQSQKNIEFINVESKYVPTSLITFNKDKSEKTMNVINKFEDDEDIQDVFHNLDMSFLDNIE